MDSEQRPYTIAIDIGLAVGVALVVLAFLTWKA